MFIGVFILLILLEKAKEKLQGKTFPHPCPLPEGEGMVAFFAYGPDLHSITPFRKTVGNA